MRPGYLITAIVLGIALILALQFRHSLLDWFGWNEPPPTIEPQLTLVAPEPAPVPQLVTPLPALPVDGEVEAPEPLPDLGASDDFVREQLEAFTAPETWLSQTELARRLAVVLNATASGSLPRSQLQFLMPEQGFPVQPVGDDGKAFLLDTAGYARFEPVLDAMLSVPPSVMASSFAVIEPLLQSATAELGEQRQVRELLNLALQQVLSTPVLDQKIVLKRPSVAYEFADPELEALSDLQKQLLRMGPEALQKIQDFARRTAQALNGAATEDASDPA